MNALWRKSFFCKPYTGDRADALRFKDEFEEAAALKNADSDYTMQDVLKGFDLGGVNGPEIVPAVRPPPLPAGGGGGGGGRRAGTPRGGRGRGPSAGTRGAAGRGDGPTADGDATDPTMADDVADERRAAIESRERELAEAEYKKDKAREDKETRQHNTRLRACAAWILQYMVGCENLKSTLRSKNGSDGYAMWQQWQSSQIEEPTETSAVAIKATIHYQ